MDFDAARSHDCTKPTLSSPLGFDSHFLRQVVVEELPPAALHCRNRPAAWVAWVCPVPTCRQRAWFLDICS